MLKPMLVLCTFLLIVAPATAQSLCEKVGINYNTRCPEKITTVVGELTEMKIEIYNKGTVPESYNVAITAALPNLEITNPSMTTEIVKPGEITSVFTSVRTLTEEDNILSITVVSSVTSETQMLNTAVRAKKFSLPEFGLIGFLQIAFISAALYMFIDRK